jgi:hypothetical protein
LKLVSRFGEYHEIGSRFKPGRSAGAVGKVIRILGTELTGATSGAVQVVTPTSTLISNAAFEVRK